MSLSQTLRALGVYSLPACVSIMYFCSSCKLFRDHTEMDTAGVLVRFKATTTYFVQHQVMATFVSSGTPKKLLGSFWWRCLYRSQFFPHISPKLATESQKASSKKWNFNVGMWPDVFFRSEGKCHVVAKKKKQQESRFFVKIYLYTTRNPYTVF